MLPTSWDSFLDLTKFELFFVVLLLSEFLQACFATYVFALGASVVADLSHAWNDPRTLHTLCEPTDHVGAAFVLILFNLYVCCHMWPKIYHLRSFFASLHTYFLAALCAQNHAVCLQPQSKGAGNLVPVHLSSHHLGLLKTSNEVGDANIFLVAADHITEDHGVLNEFFLADDNGELHALCFCVTQLH